MTIPSSSERGGEPTSAARKHMRGMLAAIAIAGCAGCTGPRPSLLALQEAVDEFRGTPPKALITSAIEWHVVFDVSGSYRRRSQAVIGSGRVANWLRGLPVEEGDRFCLDTFAARFRPGECRAISETHTVEQFMNEWIDRLGRHVVTGQASVSLATDLLESLRGAREEDERLPASRRYYLFVTDGRQDPEGLDRHRRLFLRGGTGEEPPFLLEGRRFVLAQEDEACRLCGPIITRGLHFVIDGCGWPEVTADWTNGKDEWQASRRRPFPRVTLIEQLRTVDRSRVIERLRSDVRRQPGTAYLAYRPLMRAAEPIDLSRRIGDSDRPFTLRLAVRSVLGTPAVVAVPVPVMAYGFDMGNNPALAIRVSNGDTRVSVTKEAEWLPVVSRPSGGWESRAATVLLTDAYGRLEGVSLPATVQIEIARSPGAPLTLMLFREGPAAPILKNPLSTALVCTIALCIAAVGAQIGTSFGVVDLLVKSVAPGHVRERIVKLRRFNNGVRARVGVAGVSELTDTRRYNGPTKVPSGEALVDIIPWGARLYHVVWSHGDDFTLDSASSSWPVFPRRPRPGITVRLVQPRGVWRSQWSEEPHWEPRLVLSPNGLTREAIDLSVSLKRDVRALSWARRAMLFQSAAAGTAIAGCAAHVLEVHSWFQWEAACAVGVGVLGFVGSLAVFRWEGKPPADNRAPTERIDRAQAESERAQRRSMALRIYTGLWLAAVLSVFLLQVAWTNSLAVAFVAGSLILAAGVQVACDHWVKSRLEAGKSLALWDVLVETIANALPFVG